MIIQIKEPIWYGGNPHVGIADFRIDIGSQYTVFEIIYRSKKTQERMYPYPYRVKNSILLQQPMHRVKNDVVLRVVPLSLCEILLPVPVNTLNKPEIPPEEVNNDDRTFEAEGTQEKML